MINTEIMGNKAKITILAGNVFLGYLALASAVFAQPPNPDIQVQPSDLGFQIPTFGDLLSAMIRLFFVIAGLAALFMLLWGSLSWITSGGNEEAVTAARGKIIGALVGVVLIIAVLAIIWSLEQIVFGGNVCLGLSCPVTFPNLLKKVP